MKLHINPIVAFFVVWFTTAVVLVAIGIVRNVGG